jgi:hypothetical protein
LLQALPVLILYVLSILIVGNWRLFNQQEWLTTSKHDFPITAIILFFNQGNVSSKHSNDNTIVVSLSWGLAIKNLKRRRGLGRVALGKKMTQHK